MLNWPSTLACISALTLSQLAAAIAAMRIPHAVPRNEFVGGQAPLKDALKPWEPWDASNPWKD